MAGRGPYGNSAMLNEIHTHFPALLYDSRRFTSVRDVFAYVEQQMSARFDVYSNQRRAWGLANRQRGRAVPVPPPHTPPLPPGRPPVTTFIPLNTPAEYLSDPFARLFLASLMTMPEMQTLPANFMEAIPVVATAEQIARGSVRSSVSEPMDSTCAICQDTIAVGDRIRRLNVCTHTFHLSCIDTWFQRHVECPVCRHDIRDQAPPTVPV